MEKDFIYDAFISYHHTELNNAIADKLQRKLERYVPPSSVGNGKTVKKLRIYRDVTELLTSGNLNEDIRVALEKSRFLIVLCSESITQSKYCMLEITYFKELHGGSTDNIITILTEGKPSEVFPSELYTEETRILTGTDGSKHAETIQAAPLAADVSAPTKKESLRLLNQKFLGVAARLFDCDFDTLHNREQKRFIRRVVSISAVVILFLTVLVIYSIIMIAQISTQRTLAMENLDSVKSLLLTNAIDYADNLNQQGARNRAVAVLLKVYENINVNRDDANNLFSRFRDVAIDTMFYYNETLPFARLYLYDEILSIHIVTEHRFAIVTTAFNLFSIDIDTGDIIHTYHAPEREQFVASNVHDIYAIAVTDKGRVLLINTVSNEGVISKNIARPYYPNDDIAAIYYNETTSTIVIFTHINSRFTTTPGTPTYITPINDDEVFEKIILTMIPSNLDGLLVNVENGQRIVYKSDNTFQRGSRFRMSENGRFITLQYNFEVFRTDYGLSITPVNSYTTLIDLNKFDKLLSPIENKEAMTKLIDSRFNGEEMFYIHEISVSNRGFIYLEGRMRLDVDALADNSDHRTIIYDAVNDVLIFNENLARENSSSFNRFIPIINQYYFSANVYFTETGDGQMAMFPFGHPSLGFELDLLIESLSQLEQALGGLPILYDIQDMFYYDWQLNEHIDGTRDMIDEFPNIVSLVPVELARLREEWGAPLTGESPKTFTTRNEDWLVYLDMRDGRSLLKIFDLRWNRNQLLTTFELPEDFVITACFIYNSGFVLDVTARPQFAIMGRVRGENKKLLLKHPYFERPQYTTFQTLNTVATAWALDLEGKRMIVGYRDGSLLMFNYGASPTCELIFNYRAFSQEPNYSTSNLPRVNSNNIYAGQERLGIILQTITEGSFTNVVSYNGDRSLMFGYEREFALGSRIYSIWDMYSGNIIQSFFSEDFASKFDDFSMQINSDFTYAVAENRSDRENLVYHVINVASGEIMYTYTLLVDRDPSFILGFEQWDGIFYGIGSNPHIIWVFREDILLLKQIDVSNGEIISNQYISERIRPEENMFFESLRPRSRIDNMFFNINEDCIVFLGSTDSVYSLSSGRMIFMGSIAEVESDLSAIYIGFNLQRVDLLPHALYKKLRQFPFTGTMTNTDLKVTGLYIFD